MSDIKRNADLKNQPDRVYFDNRYRKLVYLSLPFILALSFLPALFPTDSVGMANSSLRIIALTIMCSASILVSKDRGDREFTRLTELLTTFGFLFLSAEIVYFAAYFVFPPGNLMYVPHAIWISGYGVLIFTCWSTLIKFSEYGDTRRMLLSSLVMLALATTAMVPVSVYTISSSLEWWQKMLAVIYPFLDSVLLLALVLLFHVYGRGRLSFYWMTVTVAMMAFTMGDLMNAFNAFLIVRGFSLLGPVASAFYIIAYSLLALVFGAVWHLNRSGQWGMKDPGGKYVLREVFLVHRSGILICREGRQATTLDSDILSGMMTAVQDFIKDSFDGKKASNDRLRRLQYGGLEIEMEHGNDLYVVIVLDGTGTELLHERMRSAIREIEAEFGQRLRKWDGNREKLSGIDQHLQTIA